MTTLAYDEQVLEHLRAHRGDEFQAGQLAGLLGLGRHGGRSLAGALKRLEREHDDVRYCGGYPHRYVALPEGLVKCPASNGGGYRDGGVCPDCNGSGVVTREVAERLR